MQRAQVICHFCYLGYVVYDIIQMEMGNDICMKGGVRDFFFFSPEPDWKTTRVS